MPYMPERTPEGRRICLFGGTFDPIHMAHLRIAEEAARYFRLNQVLFVPAGMPPHKMQNGVAPYEDRFRMVELACRPYPEFRASRLEEKEGRSYTIDTVRSFRATLTPGDELFFLIGADAFEEIESWNHWTELIGLITFIVVTRPGGRYTVPFGATVLPLNGLEIPVSSSSIRSRLAAGEPTPELPVGVRAYIDAHSLYRVS